MEFAKWFFFLSKTDLIDANKGVSSQITDGIWDKLNTISIIVFAAMIFLSFAAAAYYYTIYNDKPGRHYTPYKWGFIYALQLLLILVITIGMVFAMHYPGDYKKVLAYEIQIIILNTIYALVPYFILSLAWCNFGWTTNAYRFLKF